MRHANRNTQLKNGKLHFKKCYFYIYPEIKTLIIIFSIVFLFQNKSQAQTDTSCCKLDLQKGNSIDSLGAEYKRLKQYKELKCCTNYENLIWDILEKVFAKIIIGSSKERMIEIIGTPDYIGDKNNNLPHHFEKFEEGELVFIYCWRGMHDFYFLFFKDDILIDKGKYYALD
jgi:hypothetical protein